eukprot:Transcript_7268.p2 GENE.Transcript_7268~~Transcript_7268.p2  ORF type:complete len:394 (-),score=148.41 Transcript_7268:875-2056(-)
MRQHDFMPGALISTVACVGLILVAANSDVHEPSLLKATGKLLWVNASTRPPLLLVLAIGGWAWVVQVCRSRGMKIEQVLGGATQPVSATYHAALSLLCVVLCARLAYFIASEHQGLRWRPWLTVNLGLLAVMVGLGCLPCRAFHADSRFSLLKALWESLIAPLAPVTFWHVIVADYLTSLAKTFSDLQLTGCISAAIVSRDATGAAYERTTTLWNEYYQECSISPFNALMLALPFWWRLMQCFKVYSVTGEQKNLWNALKYSTAFPLVYAGYLRKTDPSSFHDHLFVLCALTQSSYCFIWDVLMDWGLPYKARHEDEGCCGLRMRSPLVVSRSKLLYLGLCAFNFGLRFIWALSIFGGVPGRSWGMFFFEVVEMARSHLPRISAASPCPSWTR